MAKKRTATIKNETIKDWLKRQPQKAKMQQAFKKLCRLFQHEDKEDLDWWYRVGCQVLLLYPADDRRFGQNFIPKLANGIPIPRDQGEAKKRRVSYAAVRMNTLWSARKLVNRFSKEEEQEKLKYLSQNLTVLHIMGLLAIDKNNHKTLDEFAKECIDNGWSARELSREIQNDRGVKSSGGGRRPKPKATATAAIAVRDLILSTRHWLACYEQCLKGGKRPLKNVPKTKFNKILLKDVMEAAKLLERAEGTMGNACRVIGSLENKIKDTLDKAANTRTRGKTARSAKA